MEFVKVTKEEFYASIGNQDAHVSVANPHKHPYTTLFKLKGQKLLGKAVDRYTDNVSHRYPIVTDYYLVKVN